MTDQELRVHYQRMVDYLLHGDGETQHKLAIAYRCKEEIARIVRPALADIYWQLQACWWGLELVCRAQRLMAARRCPPSSLDLMGRAAAGRRALQAEIEARRNGTYKPKDDEPPLVID